MVYPIDFVLPWVDGNDPEWLSEKRKYEGLDHNASTAPDSNNECRYRDNGLLKFWFRGVEEFASWVNHIYFVTCGQKPEWLNLDHPKLTFVTHKDFIPHEYLPTFNANTIEMTFHRIKGLSEHFVYFNDDIFLLKPVDEELFFKDGFPVLDTRFSYPPKTVEHNWEHLLSNDYTVVNQSFNPIKSVWENRKKWFNLPALGTKRVLGNLERFLTHLALPVDIYGHSALPHLKSSLIEVWDKYPALMSLSSSHRFRSDDQVNQWLLCAWNQAKGAFYPAHKKDLGLFINYSEENLTWIKECVMDQNTPLICLNESENSKVSEKLTATICQAFDSILPDKSSFEL